MSYTVKRLERDTVVDRTEVNVGRIKAIVHRFSGISYAVIDESGKIVKNKNGQYEVYVRKATSQQVADWYNKTVEV